MPDRKSYWKDYYNKNVKPDEKKMAVRRARANGYKGRVIVLKLNRHTFNKMINELKPETVKSVIRQMINNEVAM